MCRRISVKFHSSDGGNNASKPTVDGIEFASENQVCRMCALCNGFLTCRFVSWLPLTPNFKVGILLWHLRTRFHYTRPHLRPPNRIITNIEIWGSGGNYKPDAKELRFSLANSIPPTDQESTTSQQYVRIGWLGWRGTSDRTCRGSPVSLADLTRWREPLREPRR